MQIRVTLLLFIPLKVFTRFILLLSFSASVVLLSLLFVFPSRIIVFVLCCQT